MAIVKTTHPYEFLCRWDDKTGAFKAYHFKTVTRVLDDETGEVLAMKENDPMTQEQADAAGFSLDDIVVQIRQAEVTTAAALVQARAEEAARIAAEEKSKP